MSKIIEIEIPDDAHGMYNYVYDVDNDWGVMVGQLHLTGDEVDEDKMDNIENIENTEDVEKELEKYKKFYEELKKIDLYTSSLDYDYEENSYIVYDYYNVEELFNNIVGGKNEKI